ncbi:MAG: ATP-binding cassette domain-containing protein [Planctomycetaceae bacterium]|nr:ATP-binding cassette domain-containing protein [Planctomycetaceae bacterium]
MTAAIRVSDLGKSYRVQHAGQRAKYRTLRESLADLAKAPVRRLRGDDSCVRLEEFWALKGVEFEVQPGEVVGIIGRNGAGKSTLLKILSRITMPTTGGVELHGRVGSLLEVGTGFHPELTGRENIYLNGSILGMSRREIDRRFDEIVAFAEVEKFLDTPVKRYSSGMYVRLAFAVAAHLEPEILIVDEVLAVGDAQFQKKCLGKMDEVARGGRTVLLVSHQISAVRALSHRVALLEGGRLACFGFKEEVIPRYLANGPEVSPPDNWIGFERAARSGIGGAKFVAAQYRSYGGHPSGQPYPDGPLEVTLAIEAETLRSADGLAVNFFDRYSTKLINADLRNLGRSLHLHRGRNEITFHIDRLHLCPGIYTVELWMASSSIGEVIDHLPSAFQLDVIDLPSVARPGPRPDEGGLVTCEFDVTESRARAETTRSRTST